MLPQKPTDEELALTYDVLTWLIENYKRTEPYAKNTIRDYQSVVDALPDNQDEIMDA